MKFPEKRIFTQKLKSEFQLQLGARIVTAATEAEIRSIWSGFKLRSFKRVCAIYVGEGIGEKIPPYVNTWWYATELSFFQIQFSPTHLHHRVCLIS